MAPKPTLEQTDIVETFIPGDKNLVIQAGAGCGKTSVLKMAARAVPKRKGLYIAYNKAIQVEAAASFPDSVTCKTSHGLAFGAVGRKYAHRLKAARMKSEDVAKLLKINSPIYTPTTIIPPAHVARIVMATVGAFTRSARINILTQSVPRIPGLDDTETMQTLAAEIPLLAQKAWNDILDPRGQLPFSHDCQPPGTLVRRVVQRGSNGDGTFARTEFEDVPIEQIREGDYVVSFDMKSRRGYVRRDGRRVTAVGGRDYVGALITVMTRRGRSSSYTAEHRCVVRLDCDLADGNYVVYLARRGNDYRIGRTTWRTKSQGNALGIRRRAESQGAEAMWILSVHATDAEAALAEALASHIWQIPTWQFRSVNETMPLQRFWSVAGHNGMKADRCLLAHGLDIRYPFWKQGDGWNTTRRPVVMRACNLLSGMLVLEVDEIEPGPKGELRADDGANGWAPITVSQSYYEGPVYNLDVDVDHTYIADGIATHNCYLKMWCLSEPQLTRYDYVLLDEAQDSNPPVAKVVNQQRHAQLVLVGDDAQSIYGWRGADNAMAKFNGARKTLSQSFRFGPAVAEEANLWLEYLDAPLRLRGFDQINSRIIELDEPDAILCRTNGTAMAQVMQQLKAGRRVSLVGGGDQIRKLAEAAIQLKDGRGCNHPELFAFKNWGELQDYVEEDEGSDLRPFVNLIDEHGPDVVLDTVSKLVTANPEVEISTSHKAKGREWHRVQVAADFPEPKPMSDGKPGRISRPDAMLAYVTVTRAQYDLDNTGLSWIHEYV
ncbi:hypothetical protein GBF35_25555 [Nonomuraea phyllanthi]|uniref:UvrD-helicase domain-containing protein n=1 Tax=Nonomuraea phyllanthi TaxID=2219224 RepID=UPI001293519F|nr:UvrD-helicase domain-containing protein [Nonomuraea phyllanthi]QFY09567.1 hypothetical protein GBF35_25555 [Nonomuraea phyllanthi]